VADIIAIVLLFGGGSVFLFSISPIGKAIADRIRNAGSSPQSAVEPRVLEVLEEVDQLRTDLGEVQERLDFIERVLARKPDPERLVGDVGKTHPPG
jgi:hypothetical protein